MTNYNIRQLEADELPLARQLFQIWREDDALTAAPPTDEYLLGLLSRPDFHVLVALQNGKVIGGLTAYELMMYQEVATELFIYEVGVEAAYRRQGVGRALIEFARELCGSCGLSALYVPAMADDARAVAFYQACGLKREEVAWFVQEFNRSNQ